MSTLGADKLGQRLAHILCDTDTVTVEPIIAKVTADIEPGTTQSHLRNIHLTLARINN